MSLASTNLHQNAACRDSASLVALQPLRYRNDTQWCDSMQVSQAGCRCDELYFEKTKFCDCDMLLWAWEGVYRSALKRAMSLASTNPHQMVRAETAISPVELLQSSCGSDTQWCDSMQVSQAGCRCDELYFETKFCDCDMLLWAWEGVYRSVLKASNEPCIHKST